MKKLLIATTNNGKINEIRKILKDLPFDIITLKDINFGIPVPETGKTFEENAIIKAEFVGKKSSLLTLAEDSGLQIEALGGKPGIRSARFIEGTDMDRVKAILKSMEIIPDDKRQARFIAVAAIYNPADQKVRTFTGVNNGVVTRKAIGNNGFGYDPIFYNHLLGKTNAQAGLEEKNKVSHRAIALLSVRQYLLSLNTNP